MSQDWKRRAEEISHERYLREERKREAKREAEWQKERAAYQNKLAKHQRRFRCHICGTPSSGPMIQELHSQGSGIIGGEAHWDVPTGIRTCSKCNKFVCGAHIHNSICMRCANRKGFLGLF